MKKGHYIIGFLLAIASFGCLPKEKEQVVIHKYEEYQEDYPPYSNGCKVDTSNTIFTSISNLNNIRMVHSTSFTDVYYHFVFWNDVKDSLFLSVSSLKNNTSTTFTNLFGNQFYPMPWEPNKNRFKYMDFGAVYVRLVVRSRAPGIFRLGQITGQLAIQHVQGNEFRLTLCGNGNYTLNNINAGLTTFKFYTIIEKK